MNRFTNTLDDFYKALAKDLDLPLDGPLMKKMIVELSEASENLAKSKTEIGWGHQIRSYVLQPYQLVKDLRNNLENTDPDSVLDGDIDNFLEAALYQHKKNN